MDALGEHKHHQHQIPLISSVSGSLVAHFQTSCGPLALVSSWLCNLPSAMEFKLCHVGTVGCSIVSMQALSVVQYG